MKAKAALIRAMGEPFEIEEVDLDDPRPDEIIVRIAGVGLCHTDLFMRDHVPIPMPSVFGHEGAGVVEEVGEGVLNVEAGDHVVLSFNSAEDNPVEKIQAITGSGVNFSLDITAVPSVYRQAIDSLDPTGICGLVGVPKRGLEVTLEMNNLFWGRSTRGIVMGDSVPQIFIPQLIELYKQDRFPFDKLISYYPIEEINQAVQDSLDGITVKPVLTFNG